MAQWWLPPMALQQWLCYTYHSQTFKKAEKDHTSLLPSTGIHDTTSLTEYSVTPVLALVANTHHTRATQLSTVGPPLHHNSTSCHLIVRCHCIPWTLADLSPTNCQAIHCFSTSSSQSASVSHAQHYFIATIMCAQQTQQTWLSGFCYPKDSGTLCIASHPNPPHMVQQFHFLAHFSNPPQHCPHVTILWKCIAQYFLMASKKWRNNLMQFNSHYKPALWTCKATNCSSQVTNSQGLIPNQKVRYCLLPYLLSLFWLTFQDMANHNTCNSNQLASLWFHPHLTSIITDLLPQANITTTSSQFSRTNGGMIATKNICL